MQYEIKDKAVVEPRRELPVSMNADVVVAGGGVAGLGAAVASARAGAKTVLVENLGFLGGVATANMMQNISAGPYMDGVMLDLVDRMFAKGGSTGFDDRKRAAARQGIFANESVSFDLECFKETALEMCDESGANLLLYTRACAPIMVGNTAAGIVTENKAGRSAVLGGRVIDCTGDGDLLCQAGAEFVKGREADGMMRPFALLFRLGGIDFQPVLGYLREHPDQWQAQYQVDAFQKIGEEPIVTRMSGFYDLVERAKANGDLDDWIHYLRFEVVYVDRGSCLCNTSRIYNADGTVPGDLTRGEVEGRRQMARLLGFIRKYLPGGAGAYVIDTAPTIGVRETRRFIGEHVLTEEDAYGATSFDDCIITATRNMPIKGLSGKMDAHPVMPMEGAENDLLERVSIDTKNLAPLTFQLPYRMLVPKGVENMLFAGRIQSAVHNIEAFTRSMPWCMRLGNVAGAAAALSVREDVSPRELPFPKLKEALIKQGYTKF